VVFRVLFLKIDKHFSSQIYLKSQTFVHRITVNIDKTLPSLR
jgi:hypothetical protein